MPTYNTSVARKTITISYKGGETVNFRGLFNKIFGYFTDEPRSLQNAEFLDGYTNVFTPFHGVPYDDATFRDCTDSIARHLGKMKLKHVRKTMNGTVEGNTALNYLLSTRPNPMMTATEFLEKVVAQYYNYNNAFIYIQRDVNGMVLGLYPIDFGSVEIKTDSNDDLYVKFQFLNGKNITVRYDAVIHIKRHFSTHQLFGEDNSKTIKEDLDMLHAVKSSIINSVKNGSALRGIINFEGTLREDDQEKAWKRFTETYASSKNGSGIATLDNKASFQQLTTTISTFNKGQMDFARDTVYKHFGLNEKIITGNYTEDEYIAFYESVLEPIAIKLTQEFTEKLFTSREKGHGNEIIMESNRLSYMSVASRIKVCETLLPTGAITVNEIREIFGYEGIEGGDDRLVSLNFTKYSDLTQYQLDEEKGGEGNEEKRVPNDGDSSNATESGGRDSNEND